MSTATLYLIPVPLASGPLDSVLPRHNADVVGALRHFIVENVRTARRFLRRMDAAFPIDDCTFTVLDVDTPAATVPAMLEPLRRGEDMGVLSEAGCPGVADPGALAVEAAQREGLRVVPLVGPSSILLSLMASGFNGQCFTFVGYLPIEAHAREEQLRRMAREVRRGCTQIFIETPYRNSRLVETLVRTLPGDMRLCVAQDLTGPGESIVTLPLEGWRRHAPVADKVPAIFLLG